MTTIPNTGPLSIPVAAHKPGDEFALIFSPNGRTYCFRDDLARELTEKGWSLVPEPADDLPF